MENHHGKIWWSELITTDVEATLDFYERVVGWAWDELPQPDGGAPYYLALRHGRPIAGLMRMDWVMALGDVAPQWCHFVAVADVDDAVADVQSLGGQMLRAPMDVKDVGRIAILRDTAGVALGVILPA